MVPSRKYQKHPDLVEKYKVGLITLAEACTLAEKRWTDYCRAYPLSSNRAGRACIARSIQFNH